MLNLGDVSTFRIGLIRFRHSKHCKAPRLQPDPKHCEEIHMNCHGKRRRATVLLHNANRCLLYSTDVNRISWQLAPLMGSVVFNAWSYICHRWACSPSITDSPNNEDPGRMSFVILWVVTLRCPVSFKISPQGPNGWYKNQQNLAEAWLFSCGNFLLPGSRDALLLSLSFPPEAPGRRMSFICRK